MRPTLEAQIAQRKEIDSMSDQDMIDLLTLRHDFLGRIDLWLHAHAHFIWAILHLNWFCIWCGKEHFRWTETRCKERFDKKHGLRGER
uniref:Uncharacterized protein n=1 Tax=viral metagenome TaxID=1070528 RepID=A0A6M3IHL8_9ZZZZ